MVLDELYRLIRPHSDAPIDRDSRFDESFPRLYREFCPGMTPIEAADTAMQYYLSGMWRLTKVVYTADPIFLEALTQSEDTPLYTEVLRRLPFPTFYVHCPAPLALGYLIHIEFHPGGDCLLAVCEIGREHGDITFLGRSLWFHNGDTIQKAMDALLFHLLLWGTPPAAKDAPRAAAAQGVNDWRAFGILTLVIMSRSILFLGLNSYIPLYWTDVFQAGKVDAGLVITFFCGVGVASNVLGGMLADRIGYSRVIRMAYAVCLPALLFFPQVGSSWLAVLLLAPLAVGLFSSFSAMVVLGQKYLARNVGLASGVTLGLALSVGGIATPLLGYVADNYGGLPTAMLCLVPVALVGGLASCFLRDPEAPTPAPAIEKEERA